MAVASFPAGNQSCPSLQRSFSLHKRVGFSEFEIKVTGVMILPSTPVAAHMTAASAALSTADKSRCFPILSQSFSLSEGRRFFALCVVLLLKQTPPHQAVVGW